MKKRILLAMLLAFVLVISGCTGQVQAQVQTLAEDSGLIQPTKDMLDAILREDMDSCIPLLDENITPQAMEQAYPTFRQLLEGMEGYTLTPTNYQTGKSDGKTMTQIQYTMRAGEKTVYVQINALDGRTRLAGLHITPAESLIPTGTVGNMQGADASQWALLAVAALELAFIVWMLVDCVRRRISNKPLWLLLILLLNVMPSLTFGNGIVSFRFQMSLGLNYTCLLSFPSGMRVLQLIVPVGAIVYFFGRHKMDMRTTPTQPEQPPEERL